MLLANIPEQVEDMQRAKGAQHGVKGRQLPRCRFRSVAWIGLALGLGH
jgi:hypothetical protein